MLPASVRLSLFSVVVAVVGLGGAGREAKLTDQQLSSMGFSVGPPSVTAKCWDSSHYCSEWAAKGECDRNPMYMLRACMKSCRRCVPESDGLVDRDGRFIILETSLGQINIHLYRNEAPNLTARLLKMALRQRCSSCAFFRAENTDLSPSGKMGDGFIQGTFQGFQDFVPMEGSRGVKRGHVALIPNTKDFFIALRDLPELGTSLTVFGEVDATGLQVAQQIASAEYEEFAHPIYGTKQRIMRTAVPFTCRSSEGRDVGPSQLRRADRILRRRAKQHNMTVHEAAEVPVLVEDLEDSGINITMLLETIRVKDAVVPANQTARQAPIEEEAVEVGHSQDPDPRDIQDALASRDTETSAIQASAVQAAAVTEAEANGDSVAAGAQSMEESAEVQPRDSDTAGNGGTGEAEATLEVQSGADGTAGEALTAEEGADEGATKNEQ